MQLPELSKDLSIDPELNRLLFTLSAFAIVLMSPYFVWEYDLTIYRLVHLVGNLILLYIILKHHNSTVYNIELVVFFFLVSIYTMIGGTENHAITYIPLISIFFLALKPVEQMRIFYHFVNILTVIYAIGLISYLLSVLGLNIRLGTAIAPNTFKNPYYVFFGHVEETGLPIYRFSSIFDEAGVVGTINGLILSITGISFRNMKSVILLLAGLISFSLAFYIILLLIMLSTMNLKKIILSIIVLIVIVTITKDRFSELIASRLVIQNGRLVGDNRTDIEFDTFYDLFISKGGNDLIFGRGVGYAQSIEDSAGVSSYKTVVLNYGIVGVVLFVGFYLFSVWFNFRTKQEWFVCFIFIISAYQRPDLLYYYCLTIFIGGLAYLRLNSKIQLGTDHPIGNLD